AQAPQGVRRASWLAGRVLLSRALSPLPEMVYGEQGKPAFSAGAKNSVWLFLLGVICVVVYAIVNSPSLGLVEKPLMNTTNAILI
ncbi:hypothetical protein MJI69_29895, partial [Salmonella enterica subsp. enterica serovar Anatum]|nr:hypothetical protein [Salmonella enterica subsp. enterica serovar Anatum]